MSQAMQHRSRSIFKRVLETLNYWAEVLDMDDPHDAYVLRLEERVTKLERDVEGLQIQSGPMPVEPSDRVDGLHGHQQ